ncbi:hypothetical protein [Roseovarius aestuariivivens]|uniref:hypothetical protein n=1 Tax=Roseovarius aestuariivivens TaxID=1888910 RepID=UPI001081CF72|nr:hypothetical protein [Roseovarius aestuariivivens]
MRQKVSTERLCEIQVLPDSALVRVSEIAALEDVSMSTAWRRVRDGHWPVVRVGGTTRVLLGAYRRKQQAFGEGGSND